MHSNHDYTYYLQLVLFSVHAVFRVEREDVVLEVFGDKVTLVTCILVLPPLLSNLVEVSSEICDDFLSFFYLN